MFNLKRFYQDQLYRNSIAIMLNTGSTTIVGLFFWMIATRNIQTTYVGLANGTISVITLIASIAYFGMDIGLVRFLPKYDYKNRLFNTICITTIILSLVFSIISFIILYYFSDKLVFFNIIYYGITITIFVIISMVTNLQNLALIALRRADLSFIQNILLIARIPMLVFLIPFGIYGILTAYYLAMVLPLILGYYFLLKQNIISKFEFDINSLKEIFSFSFGNFVPGIFSALTVNLIPIIIINILGPDQNAYYYIAYSISSIVLIATFAVSTAFFVEGSHNLPIKQNFIKSMGLLIIFIIPCTIIIFLFGNDIISVFFHNFSQDTINLLRLLTIANVLSALISIYISVKKIEKDLKSINLINISLSLLSIILSYIFVQLFGLEGIGFALIASYIIVILTIYIFEMNLGKIKIINKKIA